MPKFTGDTKDWATEFRKCSMSTRIHRDSSRLLQRYIDHNLLYVVNVSPDRDASKYETSINDLSIMDYGGPVGRCADLDAGWWN